MSKIKLRDLERGMRVRDGKETPVVLFVQNTSAGGRGMGEYPDSWRAVLSNGRIFSWDPWEARAEPEFALIETLDLDYRKGFGKGRISSLDARPF